MRVSLGSPSTLPAARSMRSSDAAMCSSRARTSRNSRLRISDASSGLAIDDTAGLLVCTERKVFPVSRPSGPMTSRTKGRDSGILGRRGQLRAISLAHVAGPRALDTRRQARHEILGVGLAAEVHRAVFDLV